MATTGTSSGTVALVLGKPPRPGTVGHLLAGALEDVGVGVRVALPHERRTDPAETVDPDDGAEGPPHAADGPLRASLGAADVVLHRGLDLAALERLDAALTSSRTDGDGRRPLCVNPPRAVALLADRWAVLRALARSGVPVPPAVLLEDGGAAHGLGSLGPGPLVAKARRHRSGRGDEVRLVPADRRHLGTPLPAGGLVVQTLLDGDGTDRKLYVVGRTCRMIVQPAPFGAADGPPERSERPVPRVLADLAVQAADALDLQVCGVDAVVTPEGPVVVDVNPFPAMRGVADAVRLLAGYVLALLPSRAPEGCDA